MTAVGAWGQRKRFGRNSCTFSASTPTSGREIEFLAAKSFSGLPKPRPKRARCTGGCPDSGSLERGSKGNPRRGNNGVVCREVVDEQIGVGRYCCGGTVRGRLRKRPGSR